MSVVPRQVESVFVASPLRVSDLVLFISSHQPTVKRARTHTDAVLYAGRVFKLFIFSSIAFTELCSNTSRVIYYEESFIVNQCRFSECVLVPAGDPSG